MGFHRLMRPITVCAKVHLHFLLNTKGLPVAKVNSEASPTQPRNRLTQITDKSYCTLIVFQGFPT